MIPVKCTRCGYKAHLVVPADPSTEVRCLMGCPGRMASDPDAYEDPR